MLYLFDIDGTILLTGGAGTRAINRVFERRYGVVDAMNGISAAGKTDPMIMAEIFEARLGRTPGVAETNEVIDEYVPLLREEIARASAFRIMPRAVEIIEHMHGMAGVHLGIATGNVKIAAQAKLEHIDVWWRFPTGGFGCDSPVRAALVARAIERGRAHAALALREEQIVVVGDTVRDIEAARACGVRVIAVATGSQTREELATHQPDAVFETLAELPAWHAAHVR